MFHTGFSLVWVTQPIVPKLTQVIPGQLLVGLTVEFFFGWKNSVGFSCLYGPEAFGPKD